jgi:ribosomal protein S11
MTTLEIGRLADRAFAQLMGQAIDGRVGRRAIRDKIADAARAAAIAAHNESAVVLKEALIELHLTIETMHAGKKATLRMRAVLAETVKRLQALANIDAAHNST